MTMLHHADMLKDLEQLHLSKSQLDQAAQLMAPDADPAAVVEALGERGWLTSYQVRQLVKGRGKDLCIGPYVIVAFVGEGGMGVVYKAIQRVLGRVVALKVVKAERVGNPKAIRRFQREAKATAHLSHRNIVGAYHADRSDDKFYLVMEFVYGNNLAQRVERKGPVRISRACDYIRQTALGMQHAHERGMIHRDIKPQNLMLTSDKTTIKILDLGLARVAGAEGAALFGGTQLTQDGAIIGSLDFMAPEQATDPHRVDVRADLYSIGCTFYYLLTGRVPFPGGTPTQKIDWHRYKIPTPIETIRPEVPGDVAEIVRKLMAKQCRERFQSCRELIDALEPILAARSGASPNAAHATPNGRVVDDQFGSSLPPQRDSELAKCDDSDVSTYAAIGATKEIAPESTPPRSRESTLERRFWPLVLGVAGVVLGCLYLWQFAPGNSRHDPGPPPLEAPIDAEEFALAFDGGTGHIVVPGWNYDGSYPITIELWATPQPSGKNQIVFGDMENAGLCLHINASNPNDPRWEFAIDDSPKPDHIASRGPVQWGRSTHVAVSFDGKTGRLFVDGVFQGELNRTTAYRPSARPFLIGAGPQTLSAATDYVVRDCFLGAIDEVRISKVIRYATDFKPDDRHTSASDTFLLYHLDEGQGDIAIDSSGNKHHGIVKGGMTWAPQAAKP